MAETRDAEILDFVATRFNRLDEKFTSMLAEQKTTNRRLSSIEDRMTKLERQESEAFSVLNERLDIVQSQLDGIADRLDRMEKRAGLINGEAAEQP